MTLFVVAYDLIHSKAYDEIIDALKELDSVHTQESVWYVSRAGTAVDLKNHLNPHVHAKDRLMVVEFFKEPKWTMAMPGTTQWLKRFFP